MRLSQDQLKQYHDDGFLIVRDLFDVQELEPLKEEINQQVDELAHRLLQAGKITNLHQDKDFYHRLTTLEHDSPGAAVLIHISGVLRPQLAKLWSSPKLLDIVEQLLGPEVAGHPVWNLRSKTPTNSLTTVPWHQDTAYLADGCEHTFQPTAWIPLIDANAENGALQVIRGGHRPGKVLAHHLENKKGNKASWYLYIDEADLPPGEVVTCNMSMGSVLLLNQLLPHRSTENYSDRIRWSVDLRWQRPGERHGMEGIKGPILMRTAGNPTYKIDWAGWAERERRPTTNEDFDAAVSGPWMDRWVSV
jgi:ectoine hydroxylase-related dioxygenase (phytanoyl-CoA dioxygenase family)